MRERYVQEIKQIPIRAENRTFTEIIFFLESMGCKYCPKNKQTGNRPDSLRIPILELIPAHKLIHRERGHFSDGKNAIRGFLRPRFVTRQGNRAERSILPGGLWWIGP
jgi:hypothetical protein